eukprot:2577679-Amphidinium_carterae.1
MSSGSGAVLMDLSWLGGKGGKGKDGKGKDKTGGVCRACGKPGHFAFARECPSRSNGGKKDGGKGKSKAVSRCGKAGDMKRDCRSTKHKDGPLQAFTTSGADMLHHMQMGSLIPLCALEKAQKGSA